MSLFVIGDTHLSLSTDKPMDIFGGWKNYMQRLEENWRSVVQPQDTVIIPGDVSWGMSLEQAKEDFLFLHRLPGKKILMKGNHDYWWTTRAKMESFLEETGWTV
jgi:Predicted phosphohydrolase